MAGPDDVVTPRGAHPGVLRLRAARDRHAAASLPAIVGAGWMAEHWLAAYAVLLLS